MRYALRPEKCGLIIRHSFAGCFGLVLAIFMYGQQAIHLWLQMIICSLIMKTAPIRIQHVVVFVFAMTYLSLINIRRMFTDYGGIVVNVTGSMMILTQRMI